MAEGAEKKLIEINFLAFGSLRPNVELYKGLTFDEACQEVWKICPTARILFAWEYDIGPAKNIKVERDRLDDEELSKFYKQL
jgi:hypothetical protein